MEAVKKLLKGDTCHGYLTNFTMAYNCIMSAKKMPPSTRGCCSKFISLTVSKPTIQNQKFEIGIHLFKSCNRDTQVFTHKVTTVLTCNITLVFSCIIST